MRSYVAGAAKKEERTFHLSLTFAVQSLGLVLGPMITVISQNETTSILLVTFFSIRQPTHQFNVLRRRPKEERT